MVPRCDNNLLKICAAALMAWMYMQTLHGPYNVHADHEIVLAYLFDNGNGCVEFFRDITCFDRNFQCVFIS